LAEAQSTNIKYDNITVRQFLETELYIFITDVNIAMHITERIYPIVLETNSTHQLLPDNTD